MGGAAIGDDALQEAPQILRTGADVIGDRLLRLAIVETDEPTLGAQAKANEAGIAEDDPLEALELREAQRPGARLADRLCPPGGPLGRRTLTLDPE